jgi:hypothetical protein
MPALLLGTAVARADGGLAPDRWEWGALPAIAGNSDIGIGFGAIGSLARFVEGYAPYRWRAELLLFFTIKEAPGGGVESPFHDDHLKLDFPGLLGGRLRLYLTLSFRRFFTSGYHGIGNDSSDAPIDELFLPEARTSLDADRFYQYDRIFPALEAMARITLGQRLSLLAGSALSYNAVNVYPGSKLALDRQSADPAVSDALQGVDDHLQALLVAGALWDSRDHETVPSRGMMHHLLLRGCPALTHAFGGVNLAARFFLPLLRDRLVLATRAMVDLIWGEAPFYELARHGGFDPHWAPGGGRAIRGVPVGRYHGRIKLLGNFELRARVWPFRLFGQRFDLGGLVFFDTGRIWADYRQLSHLDGDGAGLKLGLGGGLRLQWGETFLIRADVAWSPDADPVGIYFDIGHVF